MKIALPRVSCDYVNGADYFDNHWQGEIKGYFLSAEQAEKILEALVAGESHARCFDDFRANPTADNCKEAIKIMTGESTGKVEREK